MDAVASVLENYTHRALPNLGSSSRNEPHAPIHVHRTLTLPSFSHSPSSSPDEDEHSHAEDVLQQSVKKTVLKAYAALVQQYIDSQDLLVHLLPRSLVRFRDGDASNDEEVEYPAGATDDLRALLALGDTQARTLFPVEFGWGHSGTTEWTENVLQLLANLSPPQEDDKPVELKLELHSDAALISPASASLFVDQLVHLIASSSDTVQSPPDDLLSISPFAERYDPDAVHPVTEYLLRTAATHPEWPAHEIYASGDLWDDEGGPGGKEVITYGELNGRSNSVARWLIARLGLAEGKGREERICVCRQRDAWFYVLQAAIWKAGCCYVSIDPDLPPARKAYIATNSGASIVFTTPNEANIFAAEFASESEGKERQRLPEVVVPEEEDVEGEEGEGDVNMAELDGLAYLLYTSGTTGTPKGCLLTHRGLYWAIEAMCEYPRPVTTPGVDKRLALASIAFDVHISEIAQSWALGTALLSAPRLSLLADLPRVIREKRVSHMGIVPSMLRACVPGGPGEVMIDVDVGVGDEAKEGEEGERKQRCALKYLVSGGEKISDEVLKMWAGREDVILANFYGPTEATVGCTSRIIRPTDKKENIGRPFPSCEVYIASSAPPPTSTTTTRSILSALHHQPDPDIPLQIVPRGTPGELIVSGPLVAREYHGEDMEEANRKAFVEWPREGVRGYRTGDLVRMLPDGTLEILGRIDTQIKLRGVRIEAEGVSAVLRNAVSASSTSASAAKLDAATLVSTHPSLGSGEVLVSFIAPSKKAGTAVRVNVKPRVVLPQDADNDEGMWVQEVMPRVKEAANRELASYMRPAYVVPVDVLPLSMNGKTDEKVLGQLFRDTELGVLLAAQNVGSITTPIAKEKEERRMTENEGRVARLISEITGAGAEVKLGPESNAFECGLDSLGFARLARELGRGVVVAEVMARGTVSGIAELLSCSPPSLQLEPEGKSEAAVLEAETKALSWDEAALFARAVAVFDPDTIEQVLPPFPVQEGVLASVTSGIGAGGKGYVQHFAYRVHKGEGEDGEVVARRLKSAWESVFERHEILRTVFVIDDEGLVQVVLKPNSTSLPLTSNSDGPIDTSFGDWFAQTSANRIASDINQDITTPLFRINVYSGDEIYFVLSISHALYDGMAIPPLMRDVDGPFSSLSSSENVDTTNLELPVPLSSVLSRIPSSNDASARSFWIDHFKSIPPLPSPIRRSPSDEVQSARTRRVLEMGYGGVKDVCMKMRVTPQAVFAAAFAVAGADSAKGEGVGRWGEDAVFGIIRSGRDIPLESIERALCPLVSVVPVHVPLLAADQHPHQILQAVQNYLNSTARYQHSNLGQIQRWIGRKDLVEVLFSCRYEDSNAGAGNGRGKGAGKYEGFESVFVSHAAAEFILAVEIVIDVVADTVEARAAYTPSVLKSEDVENFLWGIESCVESFATGSNQTFSTITAGHTSSATHDHPGVTATQPSRILDEKLIASLSTSIASFLRIEATTITPHTSFVALGLSSLQAVSLAKNLNDSGFAVSPVDIMQADSVVNLAEKMEDANPSVGAEKEGEAEKWLEELKKKLSKELDVETSKLDKGDMVEIAPCTALQSGMLSQTINSGGKLYVHAFPFKLQPSCDVGKMKSAWLRAVQAFSILRTSFQFAPSEGAWVQVEHSVEDFKWVHEERESVEGASTEFINSLSFANEDDLARPPVYFRHVSTPDAEYVVLVMHHALYDGISLPMLFHHVRRFYRSDEPVISPMSFIRLADAIVMQEHSGTSYWSKVLQGARPSLYPRTHQETHDVSAWRSSLRLDIPKDDVQRICRRYRLHPQCLGQAAWAKVVAMATGCEDVMFGQVVSGRVVAGAKDVIGPAFNTIPYRLTITRGQTNKSLLQAAHRWNIDSLSWQHASLRSIQRALGLQTLCDTLFLYQPGHTVEDDNDLWTVLGRADIEQSKTQYAINIELHEGSENYHVFASCAADVLDMSGLQSLLSQFHDAFESMVRAPNAMVLSEGFVFVGAPTPSDIPHSNVLPTSRNDVREDSAQASWSSEQQKLHSILVDFVMLPSASVTSATNLASMGIDSISSIQVAALARKAGLPLIASDVARSTTIDDLMLTLARKLEALSTNDTATATATATPSPTSNVSLPPELIESARNRLPVELQSQLQDVFPVTPGMEWYIGNWQRGGGLRWQYAFAFQSSFGKLDGMKMRSAWESLVERNPLLRSSFVKTGDAKHRITLCVLDGWKPEWVEGEIDAEDETIVVYEQARKFVRSVPEPSIPFSRMALLHGKEESYVVLGLHHMQYDAWSMRLLVQDLETLYRGDSPTSSGDLRSVIGYFTPALSSKDEQRQYWQELFGTSFKPTLIRLNSPTPSSPSPNRARRTCELWSSLWSAIGMRPPSDQESPVSYLPNRRINLIVRDIYPPLSSIRATAQSDGLSLSTVFMATWARVQAHYTKDTSVTFGLMLASRDQEFDSGISADSLALPCLNVLPHHIKDVGGSVTIREIGMQLMKEEKKRMEVNSQVVERSRLSDVCAWVGNEGRPVCNVWLNILQVQGRRVETEKNDVHVTNGHTDAEQKAEKDYSGRLLKSLKLPYNVVTPSEKHRLASPWDESLVVPEVADEVVVEFIYNPREDTVVMSIETDEWVMSEEQANTVAKSWEEELRNYVA